MNRAWHANGTHGNHRVASQPAERAESWANSSRHLNGLHRIGAAAFGIGLCVFGVLGLIDQLDWFTTSGQPVLGLSSNGLLSLISLVVGALLIAAGVRGGRSASTVTVVIGAAFLLSGVVNVLVLDTPFNFLAFEMSNVIFSLLAGGLLLILGSWGRFTGRLPTDNPYRRDRHPDEGNPREEQPTDGQAGDGSDGEEVADRLPAAYDSAADATAVRELADAERAAVRHGATPDQSRGVQAAGQARRDEDRLTRWQQTRDPTQHDTHAGDPRTDDTPTGDDHDRLER